MNRDEFLKARQAGIGGSDSAAALGLSRYKTPRELWAEKTGLIAPENLDEIERVRFGQILEAVVAGEYSRRMNVKVRRRNQMIQHPQYPWMLANVDRVIDGERCGLEIKTVDAMAYRADAWGEPGTDLVPDEYLMQCHHYMIVLDYPKWKLAALVGGNHLVVYEINRDPALEELVIDGEQNFWQSVEQRTPPPLDCRHPTTARLLARLYEDTDGTTINLADADPDIESWHVVKQSADRTLKDCTGVITASKNHIRELMGRAAIGRMPDGSEYRRTHVNRKSYVVEPSEYDQLRYYKAKE